MHICRLQAHQLVDVRSRNDVIPGKQQIAFAMHQIAGYSHARFQRSRADRNFDEGLRIRLR